MLYRREEKEVWKEREGEEGKDGIRKGKTKGMRKGGGREGGGRKGGRREQNKSHTCTSSTVNPSLTTFIVSVSHLEKYLLPQLVGAGEGGSVGVHRMGQ